MILRIHKQKFELCNEQGILEYSQTFYLKQKCSITEDKNIKIKAEEGQSIKIRNKNKNKLVPI